MISIKKHVSSDCIIPEDTESLVLSCSDNTPVPTCIRPNWEVGIQKKTPIAWGDNGSLLFFVNASFSIVVLRRSEENQFDYDGILEGHSSNVCSLCYNEMKRVLVSCGRDGILLWDIDHRSLIKHIAQSPVSVTSLLWIDNRYLCSGTSLGDLSCWDSDDGYRCLQTLSIHHDTISVMCYSNSCHLLITAGKGNSIRLWEFQPNSSTHLLYQDSLDGHAGDITSLCLSETGEYLFSGARDNTVRYWNLKTHSCLREVIDSTNRQSLHRGAVTFMCTQTKHLITGSVDGYLRIFHINETATSEKSFDSAESLLLSYFDDDDSSMVKDDLLHIVTLTSSLDNASFCSLFFAFVSNQSIHIYRHSSDSFTHIQTFTAPSAPVSSLGFSSSNLISLSLDGMIRCYDTSKFRHIFCHETPANMLSMCFHKSTIYIGGSDYCIHCYEYDQTTLHHKFCYQHGIGRIRTMALSPKYERLITGSEDGTVEVYSISDSSLRSCQRITDHDGLVLSIALSDDIENHQYLATGGSDYALNVYWITNRGVIRCWNEKTAHSGAVLVMCFGHGDSACLLFTGGQDAVVKVWNIQSGEVIGELLSHKERITAIATSPDGRYVATASADKRVIVWDIQNEYSVVVKYEMDDECRWICFHDRMVVCGYVSGSIRLWPIQPFDDSSFISTPLI